MRNPLGYLQILKMEDVLSLRGKLTFNWASLVAQMVKKLPRIQETWVWSLGWEDPLEKRIATHSLILAWRIPWTEECGRLQSMGLQKVRHDWLLFHIPFNVSKNLLQHNGSRIMKMFFKDNGYISDFVFTCVYVQDSPHCLLSESIIWSHLLY